MLDRDGYRPNVGIIIVNQRNEVFWGKRVREHSWQFPQGGIKHGESPEEAMYRELQEETGLRAEHVRVLGRTRDWLRYEVPREWIKRDIRGNYRGQKQIWFLLRMIGRDCDVRLRASEHPEFDAWRWHDYWVPLDAVIEFKREVYSQALNELSRFVFTTGREGARFLRTRPGTRRGAGVTACPRPLMRAAWQRAASIPRRADPPTTARRHMAVARTHKVLLYGRLRQTIGEPGGIRYDD